MRVARRVLKGLDKFDTDDSKIAQDYSPTEGKTSDVITIDGQPATWDPKIRKWVRGVDNHNPDVGYDLDEVTVTGVMPRDALGLPLYDKNGRPTLYDDGGMKDNLDYVGKNIMYPVMGAIVAAPSFGLISKAFTPSTYINLVPRVAAKFGATSPTIARVASLFGAGLDMGLAGYFAHEGYNNLKNAVLHPENLLSWTDYGKLGLDALATAGPLGEANKTLTALNKGVRIPFLIDARNTNRYFNWANNRALLLQSFLSNHNFDSNKQQAARKFLYRPLNFVAGLGLKSKSWLPAIREAATKGVQRSMDIFDRYYRTAAENEVGHSIDLGKAEDYTRNLNFSYLPWDRWGYSFNGAWGHHLSNSTKSAINIEEILRRVGHPIKRNFLNHWKSVGVHETNHSFTLDPSLKKSVGNTYFGGSRRDSHLPNAYRTDSNAKHPASRTILEKSANNAEIRNLLNLSPEEIAKLPTERFIRMNPDGKITTIIDDLIQKTGSLSYYQIDYAKKIKNQLDALIQLNKEHGGAGLSEVFPNFAKQFAQDMKEALLKSYKRGGRL